MYSTHRLDGLDEPTANTPSTLEEVVIKSTNPAPQPMGELGWGFKLPKINIPKINIGQEIKNAANSVGNAVKGTVNTVVNTAGQIIQNPIGWAKKELDNLGETQVGKAFRKGRDGFLNAAGQVIRFVNRYMNPGTILLRNGWLLCTQFNLFGMAKMLRWGLVDASEAQAKIGLAPDKHNQVRNKLNDVMTIYWQAGGEKENLKKALLNGKGNRDKLLGNDKSPISAVNDEEELLLVGLNEGRPYYSDSEMVTAYLYAKASNVDRVDNDDRADHVKAEIARLFKPENAKELEELIKYINLAYDKWWVAADKNTKFTNTLSTMASWAVMMKYNPPINPITKKPMTLGGLGGLGELGEIATAAAIATVSGAVATLAATLIPLFKGTKGAKPEPPTPTGDPKVDQAMDDAYKAAMAVYNAQEVAQNISTVVQNPPREVPNVIYSGGVKQQVIQQGGGSANAPSVISPSKGGAYADIEVQAPRMPSVISPSISPSGIELPRLAPSPIPAPVTPTPTPPLPVPNAMPVTPNTLTTQTTTTSEASKESWFKKNKTLAIAAGVVGVAAVVGIGIAVSRPKRKSGSGMNGTPKNKKNAKGGTARKTVYAPKMMV